MMDTNTSAPTSWIAFARTKRIALGSPREVITAIKSLDESALNDGVLVFDAHTSKAVELDLRGTLAEALQQAPEEVDNAEHSPQVSTAAKRTPGRPKLGVVAREVTLLPRHWDWLATQSGGASVALRKLVDRARRDNKDADRQRQAREAAYRFMNAMAGNRSKFEDASRALFANDIAKLEDMTRDWPHDIREHVLTLAKVANVTSSGEE